MVCINRAGVWGNRKMACGNVEVFENDFFSLREKKKKMNLIQKFRPKFGLVGMGCGKSGREQFQVGLGSFLMSR